jgi:hypothetical protein
VELPVLGGRARLRVGTRRSVGSAVEGTAKGVKDEGVLAVIFLSRWMIFARLRLTECDIPIWYRIFIWFVVELLIFHFLGHLCGKKINYIINTVRLVYPVSTILIKSTIHMHAYRFQPFA